MKYVKLAWILLGLAWLVAVFLPYDGKTELSVWQLGQLAPDMASGRGSVYGVLVAALAWVGLAVTALKTRLSRPLAALGGVIAVALFFLLFSLGAPHGFGIGAPILIHGSVVGLIIAIVVLIRPERLAPAI